MEFRKSSDVKIFLYSGRYIYYPNVEKKRQSVEGELRG